MSNPLATVELPQSGTVEMRLVGDGTLNGHHFDSDGQITVDVDRNLITTDFSIDDIPELGNALLAASCTSYAMSTGGIFAPAHEGAARLIDITGVPYSVGARYRHTDEDGNDIGRIEQGIDVSKDSDGFVLHPTLNGEYQGPTDLVSSPGYAIYLRQDGQGSIEGTYGQTLFSRSGKKVYAHVKRNYMYKTAEKLPFDQVWRYKLLDVKVRATNGRRHFKSLVTAAFLPAEAVHS